LIALAEYDKASLRVKRFDEERVRVKNVARVLKNNNSSLKDCYKDEQREKKQLQDKVVCLVGEISKFKGMVTGSEINILMQRLRCLPPKADQTRQQNKLKGEIKANGALSVQFTVLVVN